MILLHVVFIITVIFFLIFTYVTIGYATYGLIELDRVKRRMKEDGKTFMDASYCLCEKDPVGGLVIGFWPIVLCFIVFYFVTIVPINKFAGYILKDKNEGKTSNSGNDPL